MNSAYIVEASKKCQGFKESNDQCNDWSDSGPFESLI